MNALVTDAHLRAVLAGIRGLGRAGHRVLALGPRLSASGLWSRYCERRIVLGHDGAGGLAARLRGEAARDGPLIVYPGQESTLDDLLGRPLPAGVVLPYPDPQALSAVRDKRRLAEVAAAAGLSAPRTLADATAGELVDYVPRSSCVVKPARPNGALPTSVVVSSREQLRALVGKLPADEPLLIQERARGPLVSLSLVLSAGGEVIAQFQQVALRTWPPDAGISVVAESVEVDAALAEAAASMLRSVGFGGLAQLQFVEAPGGRPALIDVNPRFYGSLPLALACGVNLPAIWHADVAGEPSRPPSGYPEGVRFRWLEGSLLHASRGQSGRMHALRAGLAAPRRRPRAAAVWAPDDPVASVVFGADLVGSIVRRRLRGANRT